MNPQTSTAIADLSVPASQPADGSFAFFFLIQSSDHEITQRVIHRLHLEFALDQARGPLSVVGEGSSGGVLVTLRDRLEGDRLASFQQHAARIAALYPHASLRIHAGHVSARKVTLAFPDDAPGRIYLRGGIWGELLCERNSATQWKWISAKPLIPRSITTVEFFDVLAAAREQA